MCPMRHFSIYAPPIFFFTDLFVCSGFTFIYNSVFTYLFIFKQWFMCYCSYWSINIHGNTTSLNISVLLLLPSGNTLHYHPDDCLESCNMDFISVWLTKLQLIWYYILEPGFNQSDLINVYFRVFPPEKHFSLITRPFHMYLHNPVNCID